MLKVIKKDLQNHYYDPTFHGLDLEARFARAEQDIEQATSLGHMFGIIAQAVLDLNDSHTLFGPPGRVTKVQYGWQMLVIGETPYVIAVKPGSDAEAKGLRAGDVVLSIDGYPPTRQNLWVYRYRYYSVRPAPGMKLVVQSPGGQPRQVDVAAKIIRGKRVLDLTQGEDIWDIVRRTENAAEEQRFVEVKDENDTVLIWNMPTFSTTERELGRAVGQLSKCKSVILDLRGNAGGYEDTLVWLLGHFFDRDVTIAQPKGRKENMDPIVTKTRGRKAFAGKLVVIVDSDTGSAAELFARVIQLEKRGTVIGDRTAGAVMRARVYSRQMGGDTVIIYGIAISESDVIMADGKSLEKVGVTPDVVAVPTGADLAAGRDPVLTRAAAICGVQVPPEEAGKLFPHKWAD
jgi:C-terminal processing protease CtpA/Prc